MSYCLVCVLLRLVCDVALVVALLPGINLYPILLSYALFSRRSIAVSRVLVVVWVVVVPSFCGVAVFASVSLPAPCASVSLVAAPVSFLFRLGYNFGWPGCVAVCWFSLSSLSLSASWALWEETHRSIQLNEMHFIDIIREYYERCSGFRELVFQAVDILSVISNVTFLPLLINLMFEF